MSEGLRRGLAGMACRVLQATLPPSLQSWGWAVRCETSGIPDDTEALLFALGSLFGLAPRAVATRLFHSFTSPIGDGAFTRGDSIAMKIHRRLILNPRILGVACAIGAVALGLAYMAIAGAPAHYLGINAGALIVGLTVLPLIGRAAAPGWAGAAIVAMAGGLIATALLGDTVDGAARWVNLGGVSIQPSLILSPLMLVAFARSRSAIATAGIVASVAAIALQPDRSIAGMLALGLAILAIMRPDRHVIAAFAASLAGFAATLARPDMLPAAPYVDQILYSAFDVHPAAGAAVLAGSVLLLVPAAAGWIRDPANRAIYAVFGAVWFAATAAAALGNYPTPMVGYGGSAIIGYALSLLALPRFATAHAGTSAQDGDEVESPPLDRHLLLGLA